MFTLIKLNSFNDEIQPIISLSASKYTFIVCISLQFALLLWEGQKSWRIIIRDRVAENYLDSMAVRCQAIGRNGYRKFSLFSHLTKGREGMDYVAFYVYFSFQKWPRTVFAETPRKFINALTVYSVIRARIAPSGSNTVVQGDSFVQQLFINITLLSNADAAMMKTLVSMLIGLIFFSISIINMILATSLYLCVLWSFLRKRKMKLADYCKRKVNSRVEKTADAAREEVEKKQAKKDYKKWKKAERKRRKWEKKHPNRINPNEEEYWDDDEDEEDWDEDEEDWDESEEEEEEEEEEEDEASDSESDSDEEDYDDFDEKPLPRRNYEEYDRRWEDASPLESQRGSSLYAPSEYLGRSGSRGPRSVRPESYFDLQHPDLEVRPVQRTSIFDNPTTPSVYSPADRYSRSTYGGPNDNFSIVPTDDGGSLYGRPGDYAPKTTVNRAKTTNGPAKKAPATGGWGGLGDPSEIDYTAPVYRSKTTGVGGNRYIGDYHNHRPAPGRTQPRKPPPPAAKPAQRSATTINRDRDAPAPRRAETTINRPPPRAATTKKRPAPPPVVERGYGTTRSTRPERSASPRPERNASSRPERSASSRPERSASSRPAPNPSRAPTTRYNPPPVSRSATSRAAPPPASRSATSASRRGPPPASRSATTASRREREYVPPPASRSATTASRRPRDYEPQPPPRSRSAATSRRPPIATRAATTAGSLPPRMRTTARMQRDRGRDRVYEEEYDDGGRDRAPPPARSRTYHRYGRY
jgi:hypothetical protein